VTRVCAVDVGAKELKLLESDGRRLTRHAEVLLPEGALMDGMPTALLTATVRSALEASGFTTTRARVAIGETGTAFRDFRLPAIPAGELSSAVLFEGRRQVPMEAADVYFAWHAVRDRTGYAVHLVAARRTMIDAVVDAVGAAGLQVERMDLKPLALARGMAATDGLLLEWGAADATLVLMVRGRPRFFRTFLLDAPPDDDEGQLDELAFAVNTLIKFMRGAASDVVIGPSTPLYLGGRFAFVENGPERAQQRLNFVITLPEPRLKSPLGFPWQAHLAGVGLLLQARWFDRLTPSQGGDMHVAA
jgi:hypothetical protein